MLAVIGGSGFSALDIGAAHARASVQTPWGEASASVMQAHLEGQPLLYLARHGDPHGIAPHRVNYRANVWQLRQCGANAVIGVNAVGSMRAEWPPGSLVLPDQLIDYTWGRDGSFFDGVEQPLGHTEFGRPFDDKLIAALQRGARRAGLKVSGDACYGVTQGPRLETEAEITRLVRDGCDLVGMTAMPEAALARELALPYAIIAVVANPAAGTGETISIERIYQELKRGMGDVARLLAGLLSELEFNDSASKVPG